MAADVVGEGDRTRRFEACDASRGELAQLSRIDGRPRTELHDADDLLAEALARPSDDDGVDDIVVPAEHLLDLLDEDLLAAAVDDQ
jgi:hypothetical protein